MYTDITAILEPLDEHFQAVFCQLVAQPRSLCVVVAKIGCGVIFSLSTPKACSARHRLGQEKRLTAEPSAVLASVGVDRH